MADTELIQVTRDSGYYRGNTKHPKGAIIPVPKHAVKSITGAKPPFGRVVTTEQLDAATDPNLKLDVTDAARKYAEENDMNLELRVGQGSGTDGRITKQDVVGWNESGD